MGLLSKHCLHSLLTQNPYTESIKAGDLEQDFVCGSVALNAGNTRSMRVRSHMCIILWR